MSHASLLIAISQTQLQEAGGDVKAAVSKAMAPFREGSDLFRDGSRWDWWQIGGRYTGRLNGLDIVLRSEINEAEMLADDRERAGEAWDYAQAAPANLRSFLWGVDPGSTRAEHVAKTQGPSFFAFLGNGRWCEKDRLGLFGGTAPTECEIKAKGRGETYEGRCITTCPETGSKIVTWSDDSAEVWDAFYWARFVRNLPGDTTLVLVDYHV